jgi:hypothetical protein
MIRMLLVGYCFGIRSERRLCDEVHLNLVYLWFCRPGFEGRVQGSAYPPGDGPGGGASIPPMGLPGPREGLNYRIFLFTIPHFR